MAPHQGAGTAFSLQDSKLVGQNFFFFPTHALSSSVGPRVLGPSKSLPLQWPQTARRTQLGAGREKGWVVVSVL